MSTTTYTTPVIPYVFAIAFLTLACCVFYFYATAEQWFLKWYWLIMFGGIDIFFVIQLTECYREVVFEHQSVFVKNIWGKKGVSLAYSEVISHTVSIAGGPSGKREKTLTIELNDGEVYTIRQSEWQDIDGFAKELAERKSRLDNSI